MRNISIALNLLLISTGIWLLVDEHSINGEDIFIYGVVFAAPLSSLVALLLKGGEGWPGLYFKRKALEERKKIEQLKSVEKDNRS